MQQSLFFHIRQFFLQFDMFGQPPTFRILGKQKYNSILGAFSTLGTIFFALAYLVVGIQELIAKDSPNVIQSERQVIETSPFFLNRNNFTLAITMADLNSQPLTTINKFFTIQLKNCQTLRIYNETSQTSNVTRNCTIIPLEACTKEHFLSETQIDYFSRIRLGSVQCIQKDYWDSHPPVIRVLQGIKTSPIYSSLTVTISICKNSTNKFDCAPMEDIKKQLNSGFYAVHLSDSLLQMNRAVNMSLDVINIQYYTFSITTSKNIFQQFKVVDTKTDSGVVFSDLSEQQVLIQDDLRESTDLYNNEYLVYHNINLSSKYSEYQRSYVKIQAILSRVGGLYQMIFLLLAAFIKPLVQLMLDIDMANELFKFNCNNKNKLNTSEDNKVIDALAGIVRSRKRLLSPRDTGRLNSENNQEAIINESLNIILKKNNQINRTIKTIIWIFIGCDKEKKKMLVMAKEKYMERLDVKLIIQKLYELDQLRDIILTTEQKKLFNYLPKPDIVQDLEQAKCLDQSKQNQQLQSIAIQEAFEAYEKVVSQGWKSGVNQKLIQSLDPEVQQLFQSLQKSQANQNQFLNEIPLNQSKVRFDVGDLADCQSIYEDCNTNPQRIYTKVPKRMNKYHETQ